VITRPSTSSLFFFFIIFNATATIADPYILPLPLKRNFTFDDVHVHGPGRIAKVSASVGVPRLVHVSHLNASPTSTSQFYRSKAAGETVVREAFPAATIVRPGPMFGHEDKFLTNMSGVHPPLRAAFRFTPSSNPTTSVVNMVAAQPRPNQGSPSTCALQ
jgi:uncharacterized protein YbjT (DUF2867 family)